MASIIGLSLAHLGLFDSWSMVFLLACFLRIVLTFDVSIRGFLNE